MSAIWSIIQDNSSPSTVALVVAAGALIVVVYKAGSFVVRNLTTPLRQLPGPPNPNLFWGNGKGIFKAQHSVLQEQWMEEYGPTISYTGLFSIPRLWTMDTRAINHILTRSYTYQKPLQSRYHLSRVVGTGLLVVEEDQHKHQRRLLNPAFGPAQVRELTEIFVEKSQELRDRWLAAIAQSGKDEAEIDVMSWLSKTTLDIIGVAGFNYHFDALKPEAGKNELNEAFNTIFSSPAQPQLLAILQGIIPFLRIFKNENMRRTAEAQKTMRRIGMQLIAEKKASVLGASGQSVEKKDVHGRDLLTLLIKANMATDIPESQRLTDEEVLAQVPTFIVAGHETTSTGTTWALFALTQHPEVQRKLRTELLSVPTENPSMEELQALPYLDMFVKEVLRHHCPVPMTIRVATEDDVIPCGTPYTDRSGAQRDHIRVAKGDIVVVPILAMNRYKPYWGEDAMEFRPERWESPPEAIASIPGVFGNILSFLGGPRSCIGYRFSLVEMKALLFTLVRSFEYELAVPADKITKRSAIVQRPFVIGDEKKEEGKMPLIVRPYVPA